MTARNQWSQGLQWGACAWLGYVAWHAVLDFYDTPLGWMRDAFPGSWYFALRWFLAPAWLLAIALIAAGSPRSRAVVGVGILAQVVMGCAESGRPFGEFIPHWAMQNFLPMCLPLLPLVVLRVEEPRVVLALLALGRWREALARSGGFRTALVAAALVSLNHGAWDVLKRCPDFFTSLRWSLAHGGTAWTGTMLPLILFSLAALATLMTRRRATTTSR
jgi:hypothetical protein